MRKNYFSTSSKIFMTVGFFALLSVTSHAQTSEDAKKLRSKTNFTILSSAQQKLKKTVVTEKSLQKFAKEKNVPYRFEDKNGKIVQLAAIDGTGNPIYIMTDNVNAAITSGVNLLRPGAASGYDLAGKDVKVLEWDGGRILLNHQELTGKITNGADTGNVVTTYSDHATHVAGTILSEGKNNQSKGMAPDAKLVGYDFNDNINEIYESLNKQEGVLSTHSYGYGAGWSQNALGAWQWGGDANVSTSIDYKFGYYSEFDAVIDEILLAAPWHTLIRSAGNHRGEGRAGQVQELDGGTTGYDCVSFGSLPKNAIIVGAVEPVLNYTGPQSVIMTPFSSWGPADDGRILPTLVADGSNVYSTSSSSTNGYTTMSGTSMATPATTGALALVQEYAKKKTGDFFHSSLIKSILTNTAKEAGNDGPDYIYGFGLLDAKAAVDLIANKGKVTDYEQGTLANNQTVTKTFNVTEGVPFKATLSWLDRPGEPKAWVSSTDPKDATFLNDRTSKLVDDLDMKITLNGVDFLPYKLDPTNPAANATTGNNIVDNIEQIYIANPQSGMLTLTFTHKGTLPTDGVPYGLAVSGISTTKDLTVLKVSTTATEDQIGKNTPVITTIKNLGTEDIATATVDLKMVNEYGETVFTKTETIQNLASGASIDINTLVDVKASLVNHIFTATVKTDGEVITTNNSNSLGLITYVSDLTEAGSWMLENFNNPFPAHKWSVVNVTTGTPTWSLFSLTGWKNTDGSRVAGVNNANKVANDWLISNPLLLKAGSKYKIQYYTGKNSFDLNRSENLEVFLGDQPDVASLTTSLNKFTWNQTEDSGLKLIEFEFTAPKDGLQHVGIKHYSDAGKNSNLILLENFKIINQENAAPIVDFTHQAIGTTLLTKYADVQFTNITQANPTASGYTWEITPNTYTFKNGTTAQSKDPVVQFNQEGSYTVKLTATNANGSSSLIKENLVSVYDPTINANFSIDRKIIYTKENAQFNNITAGIPAASGFTWEVTPNGPGYFDFIEGTSATTEHANIVFNKAGDYSVKLIATTPAGERSITQNNAIQVIGNTNPPTTFTATNNNGSVTTNWGKPETLYPLSFIAEDFSNVFPPQAWQVIDANNDGNTWVKSTTADAYAKVDSYTTKGVQTDDYLVSPMMSNLPSEYTELTFNSPSGLALYPDNLKVYYVPVKDNANLTPADIQAGTQVYDGAPITAANKFVKIDLASVMNGSPFKLAFYSNNFDLFTLSIDNVKLSKPNTITTSEGTYTEGKKEVNLFVLENTTPSPTIEAAKPNWPIIKLGPPNNVTAYEVLRENNVIATVNSTETVFIDNTITAKGDYCYKVVAIYDNINKSTPSQDACVTIDSVLSTVDVTKIAKVAAFPNPVVDVVKVKFAQKASGNMSVELYNLEGKKVVSKTMTENELSENGLDLRSISTGAYVLVIKGSNANYSTKIIKK